MIFKKKRVEDGAKKIDKIITGLIVGTAIASMVGFSQTKKGKKVSQNIKDESIKVYKKSYGLFGKCLIGTINFFKKK